MIDTNIDKYKQFDSDCSEKNNFYHQYIEMVENNPVKNNILDYRYIREIEKKYDEFFELFKQLSGKLYVSYFNDFKNKKGDEKTKAERYLKTSDTYIMILQNCYLNPINNRLNQMKTNISIIGAILSIVLAIIFQIFNYSTQKQKDIINDIEIKAKKQEHIINGINIDTIKYQNQQQFFLNDTSLDSIPTLVEEQNEQ
jgi:hypothetical protein